MMRAKDLYVVFLAKTWMDEVRLVLIQDRIKFKHKFMALRRNKAGGLVIFWKEDFDLTIETFSKNHIDITVNKNKVEEWRFTGFYYKPNTQNRHKAWARLKNLKSRGSAPWICARFQRNNQSIKEARGQCLTTCTDAGI